MAMQRALALADTTGPGRITSLHVGEYCRSCGGVPFAVAHFATRKKRVELPAKCGDADDCRALALTRLTEEMVRRGAQ